MTDETMTVGSVVQRLTIEGDVRHIGPDRLTILAIGTSSRNQRYALVESHFGLIGCQPMAALVPEQDAQS